jgi:putative toxin-antitoxin system antitoxin component (TIGR02293 family)
MTRHSGALKEDGMPMKSVSGGQPSRSGNTTGVFAEQPFALSESVRERLGATREQMAEYIGVTFRTYQRRAKKGRLEDAESAKVEMLDSLLDLAKRVLGSQEEARQWLTSPILALSSERPINLLDTVKGYERVKNKLLQIEYGMY